MYNFKRICGRNWLGNGFGTSAAEHQLVVDGKPVNITLRGIGGGSYYVSRDGKAICPPVRSFVYAKELAIKCYLAYA